MMRSIFAVAALVLIAGPAQAQLSQNEPTDTDLRAAYCMTLDKHLLDENSRYMPTPDLIATVRNGTADELTTKLANAVMSLNDLLADNINRLRAYLVPKLLEMNPVAISVAMNRADVDYARVEALTAVAHCPSMAQDPSMACSKQLDQQPEIAATMSRGDKCNKLDWLPF
jgi:hypothetical protein